VKALGSSTAEFLPVKPDYAGITLFERIPNIERAELMFYRRLCCRLIKLEPFD